MGELGIAGLIMLAVIMAIPVSIFGGFAFYTARVARMGPEATLAAARKRRELA
ncbi:hypothetical protein [Nocardiopsis suaedae]|uniref:Uncharacterized protein n=1 Tax=Nocardiopsis suaedae TaxID=3018444 RepID=A0ABT4TLG3_9ACTN|nr:hypothetical protein [Nocardiopsis suaedae]MDA2805515.1 hypothetical protein [Nocardiopsis suaedae]